MLIFIKGADSFLAREAISKLKAKYLEKNPDGTELIELDADSTMTSWADLKAVPLFATSRLIIIKRAGELLVVEQDNLATILTNLPSSSIVVVWDAKPFKPKCALSIQIDKATKKISAEPLQGLALINWIKAQAASVGAEATAERVEQLIGQYGSDLWAIQSDLTTRQDGSDISAWGKSQAAKPFAVFDYVRGQKWPDLRRHLVESFERGEAIELTLGALAAAVRKNAPNLELKRKLTDTLSEIDIALKSGLIEPADAIALLISYLPDGTSTPFDKAQGGSLGASQKRVQWEQTWQSLA